MSRKAAVLSRAIVSIAFALVALEACLQAANLFADAKVGSLYSHVKSHEDYWTLAPGLKLIQPSRYGDIEYRANAAGFRDADRPAGESEAFRILVVGDSLTFGLNIEQDARYTDRMEKALNADGAGRRFEVVNVSCFGWSSKAEWAALNDRLGGRPDLVVLQICPNDFLETASAVRGTRGGPAASFGTRLRAAKNLLLSKSIVYLRFRQATGFLMHQFRQRFMKDVHDEAMYTEIADYLKPLPDAKVDAFAYVKKMSAAVGETPFLAFMTPYKTQLFREGEDALFERTANFCRAQNIAYFDAPARLRPLRERGLFLDDQIHLSEEGNAVLADALVGHLERNYPAIAEARSIPPARDIAQE